MFIFKTRVSSACSDIDFPPEAKKKKTVLAPHFSAAHQSKGSVKSFFCNVLPLCCLPSSPSSFYHKQ